MLRQMPCATSKSSRTEARHALNASSAVAEQNFLPPAHAGIANDRIAKQQNSRLAMSSLLDGVHPRTERDCRHGPAEFHTPYGVRSAASSRRPPGPRRVPRKRMRGRGVTGVHSARARLAAGLAARSRSWAAVAAASEKIGLDPNEGIRSAPRCEEALRRCPEAIDPIASNDSSG